MANVSFVKKNESELNKTNNQKIESKTTNFDKKELKQKIKSKKIETTHIERYEIEGYHNDDPVRIIIEVNAKQEISGNIFNDNTGTRTYLHGEYINGVFELYDQQGQHYRVLNAD
jgi:hypothetical protein